MGQRAALLLSQLLLLLTASRALLAVSFPEDSAPLDVVDAQCEYAHANDPGGDGGNMPINAHEVAPSTHEMNTLSSFMCTRSIFVTNSCSLTHARLPLPSFTAVPCVQRPALWKRVAASP